MVTHHFQSPSKKALLTLACFTNTNKTLTLMLYTRYPIVARALGLAAAFRPSARASKGILHTNVDVALYNLSKIIQVIYINAYILIFNAFHKNRSRLVKFGRNNCNARNSGSVLSVEIKTVPIVN